MECIFVRDVAVMDTVANNGGAGVADNDEDCINGQVVVGS